MKATDGYTVDIAELMIENYKEQLFIKYQMLIKVKVIPDQTNEQIVKNGDDSYNVYLREPPKRGMANKRLVAVLLENIHPKPKCVRIVSGHLSQSKIIEVEC